MKFKRGYILKEIVNRVHCSDCYRFLQMMGDNCVDLTVTSPPYDTMRTYEGISFNFKGIAHELHRVTKEGGVVVWIVSDGTVNGEKTGTSFEQALYFKRMFRLHDVMIWRKPNPTPQYPNIKRYTSCFDYMFILTKGKIKTFNPLMEKTKTHGKPMYRLTDSAFNKQSANRPRDIVTKTLKEKRLMNVWDVVNGYCVNRQNKVHPAVFPEKLAEMCILSWSNQGDLVLDPFCGCYDKKTEVLTSRGWTLFKDIKKEDVFYSVNPKTKKIEFVSAIQFHKYLYKGRMYHYEGRSVDLMITPDHNLYLKEYHHKRFKFIQADENNYQTFHLTSYGKWRGRGDYSKAWFEFLGFYLGDGYKITRNNRNRMYRIGFKFKKERKVKYLTDLLKRLKINYKMYKTKDKETIFHIGGKNFYRRIPDGKSHTKRIPDYVFKGSVELIDAFIKGFLNADGCKNIGYSCNSKLLDDLQTLCFLSGKSATKGWRLPRRSFIKGKEVSPKGKQYHLSIYPKKNKKLKLGRENINEVSYDGFVYCVTLEKNHLFLIRRNGKMCLCGNSGTTPKVAKDNNRDYIGIDISSLYVKEAERRISHSDNFFRRMKNVRYVRQD